MALWLLGLTTSFFVFLCIQALVFIISCTLKPKKHLQYITRNILVLRIKWSIHWRPSHICKWVNLNDFFSNRVDNSFKEALAAKVWEVEHSIVGKTFVDWKRVSTGFTTKWRESKIDLDILLWTFLFDRFLQLKLMWPSTGNNEDNSVVGHFVQGDVKSWVDS